ncbi:carboxypeptidase-like regulatory domain-containing protein [Mucilaginibacter robiniae]|uniref:Carboxypeptidase-like regulatory domain-containing protein n=2 Tax=Mucilaginibacter robiniae TaxID=2728022 RepID=A0A7L5E5M4_9SPHI|nr:carboxypeptidase-like regulatory domain-containing protein [Mucilaginibacter robiniae]
MRHSLSHLFHKSVSTKFHDASGLLKGCTMLLVLLGFSLAATAQNTVVKGTITDAKTHEPLGYVTVAFAGSTRAASTNDQGKFTLTATDSHYTQLKVSFVGYKTVLKTIEAGKEQMVNIALWEDKQVLNEVVVKAGKKSKYHNKGNPAVELIRKVIAHKNQNRLENYNYAEYRQYERMNFYLSNLSEKFKNKRLFKNYQFMFQEQDSTAIGGKNLLPIYMEEKLSQNYYRKAPYAKKQIIEGTKQVKYDEKFIDNQGLSAYFNRLYQDINIYDNNVSLVTNQLLSPIADHSPDFYKFFITDTLKDQSPQLIELSFTPRNTNDLLFEGKLYVTMDGNYAVERALLTVNKNINLNFVRQMQTTLAFEKNADGKYHLSQSDLKMEFGINKNKGGGIYGERKVILDSFMVNKVQAKQVYDGPAQVYAMNSDSKDDKYWTMSRPDTIPPAQAGIYKNIDSLQTIPSFKRTADLVTLFVAGYKNLGPFEVGPVNTFYSFNPVEGFRGRLGGRSTPEFSKRYYFETYGAYGTRDQQFKYFLSSTYSLNNKSIYAFPQSYVRASYQHDTKIPGQELQFVEEDNFLLSFKRGNNDVWLYNNIFRLDYVHEFENHFSYHVGFKKWDQSPAGALYFKNLVGAQLSNVNEVHTSEVSLELRYAPHERFYQGKLYRTPIIDRYPIFTLRYNQGINGLWGGNYNYQNVTANINKRFYLSQLGYTDVTAEGNYIFGNGIPFPLLDIHHANQTYAFQLQSYNLMNFLEFVSDHYASINIDHNFNGFFFNKVPLFKKLKWREIVDVKALWGGVRSQNNPANNASLLRFPLNGSGSAGTYTLNNGPYVEGSVGVGNILKLLRVDLVHRFTYLDNPGAPAWGIRTMIKFDF